MSQYRVEVLRNGLVRVEDRRSGLVGLYTLDGRYRSGDLRVRLVRAGNDGRLVVRG